MSDHNKRGKIKSLWLPDWGGSVLFARLLGCFNRWPEKGDLGQRPVQQDLDECLCQPAKDSDDHNSTGSIPSAQSRRLQFITSKNRQPRDKQREQKAMSSLTIVLKGPARAAALVSAAPHGTFAQPLGSDSHLQRFLQRARPFPSNSSTGAWEGGLLREHREEPRDRRIRNIKQPK